MWYDKYLKENPTRIANNWIEWGDGIYRHRDNDLPAIIYSNGARFWYKHGDKHRERGPAIIYGNGDNSYYNNGADISSLVNAWIEENNYPKWVDENSWDDNIKLLFKLTFF